MEGFAGSTLSMPVASGAGASIAPAEAELQDAFARLAAGDLGALGPIYDSCANEIYGLALWRTGSAEDARDVVQEVFCRLASRTGRLARIDRPRAYLMAMTHHAAVDRGRRRSAVDRPRADRPIDDLVEPVFSDAAARIDARRASRALADLAPAQREAIYLRLYHELSFREIARMTSVPTFTAASRYRLGLRRLRKLLGVRS
jgi:RNA polymerase sigma-70 factor (ECF subfamily)